MPSAHKKAAAVPALTRRQLRVLQAVGSGAATLGRIGNSAGLVGAASGLICAELSTLGLLAKDQLDVDGKVEVVWLLTPAGQAAANGRAMPAVIDRERAGKVGCLAPILGSNRMLGAEVGALLAGRPWVGVPFAGSMAEVQYFDARTIICNDLHCHVINLAKVTANDALNAALRWRLRKTTFHAKQLQWSQDRCRQLELQAWDGLPCLDWAVDYFVCAWMSRNNTAGTKGEFHAPLSVRWNAGGGDSVRRFRNAAAGLVALGQVLERCTFESMDAFDFIARCEDTDEHGIYCDPPFPGPGSNYKFSCGKTKAEQLMWHQRLVDSLLRFDKTRIVVRLYETDLVRGLYPEAVGWVYNRYLGRTQGNKASPEVLITRN